ncbi:T9SS type A sorting domain-containing protein [Flavobacterium sp. '19STA2R22 D10 B1']|uniref:T9SS type A sorting domain-containing protein n=1 Tax=Flavobacterium aerium TaxID=3037261 RepID=UPI00278BFDD8|nr:T9SS type A sorting domain-containing protein [Flavobacterium sp. '19STA2R22 D10 B1']
MKNILWILLIIPCILSAQGVKKGSVTPSAGVLRFHYDDAGNQIERLFHLPISDEINSRISNDTIPFVSEDFVEFFPGDLLSYYPNPVVEELYLKWIPVDENVVTSIVLHSLNGQLLKEYQNLEGTTRYTIPFQQYPRGVYNLLLLYVNGQQKSIKIIKE